MGEINQALARPTRIAREIHVFVIRTQHPRPRFIHQYPSIAEEIRVKLGASSREWRNAARDELRLERKKTSNLPKELAETKSQITKLASINETLLLDDQVLWAEVGASNVRRLGKKNCV